MHGALMVLARRIFFWRTRGIFSGSEEYRLDLEIGPDGSRNPAMAMRVKFLRGTATMLRIQGHTCAYWPPERTRYACSCNQHSRLDFGRCGFGTEILGSLWQEGDTDTHHDKVCSSQKKPT